MMKLQISDVVIISDRPRVVKFVFDNGDVLLEDNVVKSKSMVQKVFRYDDLRQNMKEVENEKD